MTSTAEQRSPGSPGASAMLSPRYRWTTIGMVSLVFLAAFESLAVTTVMPTVARALDGEAWYSVAFSATIAAGVIGMVACGSWSDRTGPRGPLLSAIGLFAVGLLVAGLAQSIEVFVLARFLQGLGAGGLTVSLLVLVARIYDPADHPRIFGLFAAAWVVPSMVGPTLAGAIAQATSWRLVFLGVVLLTVAATAAMAPALRRAAPVSRETDSADGAEPPASARRIGLAVLVAGGVVVVDAAGRASGSAGLGVVGLAMVGIAVAMLAARPLVPRGTFVVRRGLPAVIVLRALVAGTFYASDVYLPYLVQVHHDVPAWLSGVTLTATAVTWAAASQVQARLGDRLAHDRALRIGALLLLVGVIGTLLAVVLHLPVPALVALWAPTGAGMGLLYSRISAFVLAASTPGDEGENSAAMLIADSVGGAVIVALSGLVFGFLGEATSWTPFVGVYCLTLLTAAAAVLVSRRARAAM